MKKFGLIGHPIAHSFSPSLFKAAYGGEYPYDLIEGNDFEDSYRRFLDGYDAINVTAPFKEKACRKANTMSPECKSIGACNVLKKTADGVMAFNTDYIGVMKSLLPHLTENPITPVTLIVGCGGAGKAAAYAARKMGNTVVILNRDLQKAEKFAQKLRENTNVHAPIITSPLSYFCRSFKVAGTIIYTLPEAIPQLQELKKAQIRGGLFKTRPKLVLEANYLNPTFTSELKRTIQETNPDIRFIDGKQWLLHQAVEAYGIFTDKEPNISEMLKVL